MSEPPAEPSHDERRAWYCRVAGDSGRADPYGSFHFRFYNVFSWCSRGPGELAPKHWARFPAA